MTPAIQDKILTDQSLVDKSSEFSAFWGNADASEISGTLTRIFKKLMPFPQIDENLPKPKAYVGIDLGERKWIVALLAPSASNPSLQTFIGDCKRHDFAKWLKEKARRLGIEDLREITVCFEVGRCGVWPMKFLNSLGVPCVIMSSDVLYEGCRKAKSDRLDARRLVERLRRFYRGEGESKHVHVPAPDEIVEARSSARLRDVAVKQRTSAIASFKSLLSTYTEVPSRLDMETVVPSGLRDCLGRPLPPKAVATLEYHLSRYKECRDKVRELDREARLESAEARRKFADGGTLPENDAVMAKLGNVVAVGPHTSRCLARELFWKKFGNVRQVGSATGLVDVPDSSGTVSRSEGISRCANGRIRKLAVELAWLWVRLQPDSEITRWFAQRVMASRAGRKTAIVAVARKLVVALWKYVEFGTVPKGARLRTA